MKQPIIGVTMSYIEQSWQYRVNEGYTKVVEAAGGVPLLLPASDTPETTAALAALCDGFLFTGGGDIDPACYGEAIAPACGAPCARRDETEKQLWQLALRSGKPVLGICRGIQAINVFSGGDLYQDIPTEVPGAIVHHEESPAVAEHSVRIEKQSRLAQLAETEFITVNSYHHQAVRRLGNGLKATAFSTDGLIEAVEATDDRWLLGVQWHPERTTETDAVSARIFLNFIAACRF